MGNISSACKTIIDQNGNTVYLNNNVGGLCWFFIVCSIIGFLIRIGALSSQISNSSRKKSNISSLILQLFGLLIDIVMIYMLYTWCKLCRGWQVFFIWLVITIIQILFSFFTIFL
jgi:hypothetical protein